MDFKETGCEFAEWMFCSRSGPVAEIFKHDEEFVYLKIFPKIHNDLKNFL